jgi:hypothetical protein
MSSTGPPALRRGRAVAQERERVAGRGPTRRSNSPSSVRAAAKPLGIQLDCASPMPAAPALIDQARRRLADYKIRLVVNVLG